MNSLIAFTALLGCGEKDGVGHTGETAIEEVTFSESSSLSDPLYASCERNLYWPVAMTHFPVAATPVETPEPPYDIVGFSAEFYNADGALDGGRNCKASKGVRVFAYVSDAPPDSVEPGSSGMPELTPVAEAILKGADDEGVIHGSVTLDEPVRVEEGQTLWVGYDASEDNGVVGGVCFSGCSDGSGDMWMWMAPDNNFGSDGGWENRTDAVLLAVDVDHN